MTHPRLAPTGWQFGQVARLPFDAPDVDDRAAVKTWLPAAVPGSVRLDLLAQGMLAGPAWRTLPGDSEWVDAADWWYRTTLKADVRPGERAFVRFYGLDYRAAIFVNGRQVARREGMFSRHTLDVTEAAAGGRFELAVRLWGGGALPRRALTRRQKIWRAIAGRLHRSWVGVYPPRSAGLKAQMWFGWDFAPRLLTVGIWDDVETIVTGDTFIQDCQVHVDPQGRGAARLTLNSRRAGPVDVRLTVAPHNFRGDKQQFTITLSPSPLPQTVPFQLDPRALKLWHPWDRGLPHLYTLRAEVPGSHTLATRFGVRSVELQNWQFRLNGAPEFIRGLNWVPADIFPGGVTPADYAALLRLAKESGANMLRVWGGGLKEKRAFYALCDELGLLVWQEFPFACMFLGTYPRRRAYLSLVRQEVSDIVRQLDNHPSVVAWCGGNEFSPRRNRRLAQTVSQAVQTAAVSPRPFIPASPGPGDSHNWLVWHGRAPLQAYRREKAPFLSEFGLQALPHRATLTAILPHPERDWESRHGDSQKLRRYLRPFLRRPNPGLPALIAASQQAQAAGLQIAIEHMRRRKPKTGGAILWQFNEPWPGISWAIVDYFRRPKLAYRLLKQWYSPVLVCLNFEPGA
ncbi:MAG: glycoside hydrolase family 2 protein, partial [Anaerolineae bacterium]